MGVRSRVANWGSEPYWHRRIAGYLSGELNPRDALAPRTAIAAMDGERLAGFIAGHLTQRYACEGELEWIDVSQEVRRMGIARELLRRLAAWFLEHDAKRICVDVSPGNTAARSFYLQNGAVPLNPGWLVWNDISHLAVVEEGRPTSGGLNLEPPAG